MPTIPLPENASLGHLRKQAKLVQRLVRSGDDGALDMVDEFNPRPVDFRADPTRFKRSDAQLVVARLYGFESWTKLRNSVTTIGRFARPDPADRTDDANGTTGDRFVSLACVSYGDEDAHLRLEHARQLLAADPSVGTSTVAALAVTGEHEQLTEAISVDPSLVSSPCGPNNWPPLLYVAYSRIPDAGRDQSSLRTAKVLLNAGADPDVGFLWRGLVPPFTALTGAFGRGEQDQPAHAHAYDLARLLLDAGADPNDGQTMYNNGLAGSAYDDATHLKLLVSAGLGVDRQGPWYQRFGGRLTPPADLLYDELEVAALRGLPNRMTYLVTLGLDLDRRVGRSRKSPVAIAELKNHGDVLDILVNAGAARPATGGPGLR